MLTLGTTNVHKLSEIRAISGVEFQGYSEEDLRVIEENGGEIPEIQSLDIIKIVKAKALAIYRILQRPVIVEDTGLFIDCMDGFPGPFVKYIVDGPGLWVIIKTMEGIENRVARAITGVAMFDGKEYTTGYGELSGIITEMPRGDKFGWSNIFEPDGTGKTFGEMTEDEKNKISMRKLAILDFMNNLKNPR